MFNYQHSDKTKPAHHKANYTGKPWTRQQYQLVCLRGGKRRRHTVMTVTEMRCCSRNNKGLLIQKGSTWRNYAQSLVRQWINKPHNHLKNVFREYSYKTLLILTIGGLVGFGSRKSTLRLSRPVKKKKLSKKTWLKWKPHMPNKWSHQEQKSFNVFL